MRPAPISYLACLLLAAASVRAAPLFVQPLEGVPYVDWTIVNYVDHDDTDGIEDYRGGAYTYDGHNGTDFTLPNFVAMDCGFAVYAAADGTVLVIHDGEFDRNTSTNNLAPNYVIIEHGDGIETWYLHLRKDSVLVTNGQPVTAGQRIAEVGSSGNSTDAHLHFEVVSNGVPIDPFLNGLWLSPMPYAGDTPGLLDSGLDNDFATLEEMKERATNQVIIGADDTYYVHWVQVHGLTTNNTMRWEIYNWKGQLLRDFDYTPTNLVRYQWFRVGWTREISNLGTPPWHSVFKVDDVVWSELEFYMGGGVDTDGDTIDDFLETPPLAVGQNDQQTDSDGDGASNADEMLAGTDPSDPDSFLQFTNLVQGASDTVEVSFPSVGGRFYLVESCTNPTAGQWVPDHPVPGVITGHASTATMDTASARTKFYRLKIIAEP